MDDEQKTNAPIDPAKQPTAPAPVQTQAARQVAPKPETILIDWREQRLMVIHVGGAPDFTSMLSAPGATLSRAQVQEMLTKKKPIHIIPGLHAYPYHVWEAIKDHPGIKDLVKDGKLEVQTKEALGQKLDANEDSSTPASKLPANLGKMSVDKARALAGGVQDLDLLKKWLEAENIGQRRSSVVDLLKEQIRRIEELNSKLGPETKA